ncbi:MAG: sigma-70 family RNA polymerase sigma factor [Phycisphaeraceae bacterium]|nr:sigma-70 family RNA polymerase sigma factor [Phycisphaeraceae bacterium]
MTTVPRIPVEPPDQTNLVECLRSGDAGAYEQIVRDLTPRMLATAKRFLGSEADAEDAVQEAFLSAFKNLDKFQEGSQVGTWIHRILINAALMKLRSRNRRHEASIEDLLPKFDQTGHAENPAQPWNLPGPDPIQADETRRVVREAIESLPDAYRTVLILRDVEQLDTESTAAALGISSNAVKTRLHRARQALRTLLDPHFRPEQSEPSDPQPS